MFLCFALDLLVSLELEGSKSIFDSILFQFNRDLDSVSRSV